MSASGWPDAFLKHFSPEQLLTENYLFSTFADGRTYCKACGDFPEENRKDHLDFHRQELEIRLEERRQDASVRRQEALRAARNAKAENQHTVITIVNHGPSCSCEECKEAF